MKELRSIGIQPDILLCRSDREIPREERRKLALFCNVRESAVIQALDVASIYDVPLAYHAEGLDQRGAGRLRHRAGAQARPDALGRSDPSASTTPRARSRSPSSASTPG